jgi:hypothetical protein
MQGRIFNFISVSALVGIIILFVTFWNLQSQDVLYTQLEEFEKAAQRQRTVYKRLFQTLLRKLHHRKQNQLDLRSSKSQQNGAPTKLRLTTTITVNLPHEENL